MAKRIVPLVVCIILAACYGGGCQDRRELAEMLAAADGVNKSQTVVLNRYSYLIDSLSEPFGYRPEQTVGGMLNIQKMLEKEGFKEQILTIMEEVNRLAPLLKRQNTKIPDFLARYITWRKGHSREEALNLAAFGSGIMELESLPYPNILLRKR